MDSARLGRAVSNYMFPGSASKDAISGPLRVKPRKASRTGVARITAASAAK